MIPLVEEAVLPQLQEVLTKSRRHHDEVFTLIYIVVGLLYNWMVSKTPRNYMVIFHETPIMEAPSYFEHLTSR